MFPHAVSAVNGTVSSTFTYDLNGSQIAGLGRGITYTSYNKPSSITQGSSRLFFSDDVDHQRFKQQTPEGTNLRRPERRHARRFGRRGDHQRVYPRRPPAEHSLQLPPSGMDQANLTVLTGAYVNRLTIEGNTVTSVEFEWQNEIRKIKASSEVVLSAGAIHPEDPDAFSYRRPCGARPTRHCHGVAPVGRRPELPGLFDHRCRTVGSPWAAPHGPQRRRG
jgi:choline dehydrogenase-like flavoprotein